MITQEKVMNYQGKDVFIFELKNEAGHIVTITNYGATLMKILVPDKNGKLDDVNLGFDTVEQYIKDNPFFGCTVGRYANRIGSGKFTLNGADYTLACNENPHSHLHGGKVGFDKKVWDAEIEGSALKMTYVSADGEEGYPGELKVTVTFGWSDADELSIDYQAVTDKDTILNLTNHSYFSLNGATDSILDHEVVIASSSITPVDAHLIPTGEIMPISGTAFDFNTPHKIGERIGSDHPQMVRAGGYDHNFIIDGEGLRFFASLYDEKSGRMMEVFSDQPAVQLYSSNFMSDINGKKPYHYRWAACFETQNYPDAINHSNFPSCVLKPGETYHTITKYRFSVKK